MRQLTTCLLLLLIAVAIASAQGNITFLNPPHSTDAQAYGINNNGQVVGAFEPAVARWHGFLYDVNQGTYVTLKPPGPPKIVDDLFAWAINDGGAIAGWLDLQSSDRISRGFLRSAQGVYTKITDPNSTVSQAALGINTAGDMVGYYVLPDHVTINGYLLHQGVFTDIIYPGQSDTSATGINDAGTIVGGYLDSSGRHGFILQNNAYTEITIPGATQVDPYGINNLGDIAGDYVDSAGALHGFLLKQGVVETIDCPGAMGTVVHAVNDSDVFVGTCYPSGVSTAFMGTP